MKIKTMGMLIAVAVMFLIPGCGGIKVEEGQRVTTVDLRAMQTREFETTKQVAIRSVVEMFQDLGLSVGELNENLGIISTDVGPLDFSPTKGGNVSIFGITVPASSMALSGIPTGSSTGTGKGTANIEEIGERLVRIRVNFTYVREVSQSTTQQGSGLTLFRHIGLGGTTTTKTTTSQSQEAIKDEQFYRLVFERIEKSIFLRESQ